MIGAASCSSSPAYVAQRERVFHERTLLLMLDIRSCPPGQPRLPLLLRRSPMPPFTLSMLPAVILLSPLSPRVISSFELPATASHHDQHARAGAQASLRSMSRCH